MKTQTPPVAYPTIPEKHKGILPSEEMLQLFPPELISEFQAFLFEKEPQIRIAAIEPGHPGLRKYIVERFGTNVEWHQADASDIQVILDQYERNHKEHILRVIRSEREPNGGTVKLVDRIVQYAAAEKASDIHIEPRKTDVVVRFRIDGMLFSMFSYPRTHHDAIVARFKILANLKIDEYRRPQDGRFEIDVLPRTTIRISIVPTINGEKLALRILDESNARLVLRDLGFSESQEAIIRRNIEKPFGLIVASGPTGSGKTTSLYSLIDMMKKDDVNISTLEDPVEYTLPGVNQIQINTRINLTFAAGLRALLRQDPDIIMVGEIRDAETAIMAADAALTGHLVLTTMHTNDAPSAITRFLEMKVQDFVVASTTNLVIAQRLVRKVCERCAQDEILEPHMQKKIAERHDIAEVFTTILGSPDAYRERKFRRGAGCATCMQTGYSGRVGLYELLEMDSAMHELVLDHTPAERIKTALIKRGYRDIAADGVQKALDGTTTIDEVLHATRTS